MVTKCPNPKCKHEFEVADGCEGKNSPCPSCGQVITIRSLRIIQEVERQHLLRCSRQVKDNSEPVRFSALLEDIRSLWNVGSIFRSADGAGFTALHLCGITGCPPHKSIAKTSLGAEDHVGWQHYSSALDILPKLSANGVQVVALEKTEQSETLSSALARNAFQPPICLLVGNEVAGISAECLSQAILTCHLPMHGIKTSLNVAVAFGIAAYQIRENLP